MSFLLAFGLVAGLLAGLASYAALRQPTAHRRARMSAAGYLASIAPRLPFALIAAECLGRLLPRELVAAWIGADAGLSGVLVASVFGAVLPGGPMLAFPLAIALMRAGAGAEALVALVTAWSLIAVNRTLLFELPLLGSRFTAYRLVLSAPLAIMAGALAAVLVAARAGPV